MQFNAHRRFDSEGERRLLDKSVGFIRASSTDFYIALHDLPACIVGVCSDLGIGAIGRGGSLISPTLVIFAHTTPSDARDPDLIGALLKPHLDFEHCAVEGVDFSAQHMVHGQRTGRFFALGIDSQRGGLRRAAMVRMNATAGPEHARMPDASKEQARHSGERLRE